MLLEGFLENSAELYPDKTALVCGDVRLSYRELEKQANRFAHGLIGRGVERGDRVTVYLDNSVEACVSIWGILKAGAVFMMVNPTTKTDKLRFVLRNARASTVITDVMKMPRLSACLAETPHLRLIVGVGMPADWASEGGEGLSGKTAVDFERALTGEAANTKPPPKRNIDIDLAALVYTSGSTGNPKGVMLTHLNMVSAATSITTYLRNTGDDVILNVLPLAFDYGLYQLLMSVKVGGTLVLERSFGFARPILRKLIQEKVTGFPVVPTMLAMLLQMDLSGYDFNNLRYVSNTGAALPTDHIKKLRAMLPNVDVFAMYGLTECKRVSYLPPDQIDIRPGSVGRGMPNIEVYIIDNEGRRVPAGVIGELVVRGSNVMKGYWENPEATAKRLKPGPLPNEMVLYTGDLFRMDDEGYLYFIGRRDDMIKSRGEKVIPLEVENVLHSLPGVSEAAVIGVTDPVFGKKIKAFVVPSNVDGVSVNQVLRHCAENLEDFMVPQIIEFRDSLPRGETGKVDKLALAQEG
ncbi:MAG: AMP-binding protein [Desulfobacteraceae bacterium]|nr:AMP-binding protein [Desulfobacteraceae bacterium]